MKKILVILLAVILSGCGIVSAWDSGYTKEPKNNLYTQDISDVYDAELGFDMRVKYFFDSFKYYLSENELDYEIVSGIDYKENGVNYKAYNLTNDVIIICILNSKENIAAFATGSVFSESDSLGVLIDIFKAETFPYPDNWRDIYDSVSKLKANVGSYNYGFMAFYKIKGETTGFVFAPANYVVR